MTRSKKDSENEVHNSFKDDKEKANVGSSVIIEEPSDAKDLLCATMAADRVEVNGTMAADHASVFIHAQNMQITKSNLIDSLLLMMFCYKHGLWVQLHHSRLLLLRSVLMPLMQATMDMYTVKSVFVRKKRLLQTCWMLRGLKIKTI